LEEIVAFVATMYMKRYGIQQLLEKCVREPHNIQDQYAVAMKEIRTIVGLLPRINVMRVCLLFLHWGLYSD